MVIITQSVPKESLDSRLAEYAPRQRVSSLLKKIRTIEKKTKDNYLSVEDTIRHIALIIDPIGKYSREKRFLSLINELWLEHEHQGLKEDRRKGRMIPLDDFLKELKSWRKSD